MIIIVTMPIIHSSSAPSRSQCINPFNSPLTDSARLWNIGGITTRPCCAPPSVVSQISSNLLFSMSKVQSSQLTPP
jgi:hypothetical protein